MDRTGVPLESWRSREIPVSRAMIEVPSASDGAEVIGAHAAKKSL